MTIRTELNVSLGERSYPIIIGVDLLRNAGACVAENSISARRVFLISNPMVFKLYGEAVVASMLAQGFSVDEFLIPDGEIYKSWDSLEKILTRMLELRLDRSSVLVALGGGVVGDIGGFAAAIFQRGINFIQIPTTLLAQVDSSVGGKVAINHPLGKNMIGAFYQPKAVLVDLSTLATLPAREVSAGLAEVVKYGLIGDAQFVEWLLANAVKLRGLDMDALEFAVRKSCVAKAQIVAADETENGVRALLNFGHTFAHAIESGLGYGAWLHGEAVGAGMVAAAELSHRLGRICKDDSQVVRTLVDAIGCPVDLPVLGSKTYWDLMLRDKKNAHAKVTFILLSRLGRAEIVNSVKYSDVAPQLR